MSDVFMYADETGNLDYDAAGKDGATRYFGFGTAVFPADHATGIFDGMRLRARLESEGLTLPHGFHAKDDSIRTKNAMFGLIESQRPRFDTTFLCKENAYRNVRERGQMYLYKMAWYLHFKEIALQVSEPGDTLYVVVGTFGTKARQAQARAALDDVCRKVDRDYVLCVWAAGSSWGLQVADYALWAVQRQLQGQRCTWYEPAVEPTLNSMFLPWGRTMREQGRLSRGGRDPLDLLSPA